MRLTSAITNFLIKLKPGLPPSGFITGYLLIGFYLLLPDYLIFDSNFYIGIVLLPYVAIFRQKGRVNFAYFILATSFLAISLLIPLRIMYYLALGLSILFVLESYIGKLNYLLLFLLVVLSPVFKYLTAAFGFPIRLELSNLAGSIIKASGYQAQVKGNMILVNGYEFAVDAACVGLQMLITSFLTGLFILAYYERKTTKQLSFTYTMVAMGAVFIFNIGCNLIRIVILVVFKLMPQSPLHYLAGIVCLIVYVIIPVNFIIKWLFARTKADSIHTPLQPAYKPAFIITCNSFLFVGILLLSFHAQHTEKSFTANSSPYHITGYNKQVLASGVIKFEKADALIYVKPVAKQYGVEHSPMVCWQGSGYTFKKINKTRVHGNEIYTGLLEKDKDVIHTAWWFSNGKFQTIHPLTWRWQAFRGEPEFSLINVNAVDEQVLLKEVKYMLAGNWSAVNRQQ